MKQSYTQIEGKFYQECSIIMLPTKEKTNIVKQLDVKTNHLQFVSNSWVSTYNWEYQHLYFISNEEIKKGDWVYTKLFGVSKVKNLLWSKQENAKKIIATTDEELKFECQACHGGNFCNICNGLGDIYLPRPSNEFLKKFCELGCIDKVLVEMIYLGKDGCKHDDNFLNIDREKEKAFCNFLGGECNCIRYILKIASDNTITCKPIQEKKEFFTEKELHNLISEHEYDGGIIAWKNLIPHLFKYINYPLVENWIERE